MDNYFTKEAEAYLDSYNINKDDLQYKFVINSGKYLDQCFKKINQCSFSESRKKMLWDYCTDVDFIKLFFSPFKEELVTKIFEFIIDEKTTDSQVIILTSHIYNNLRLPIINELINNNESYLDIENDLIEEGIEFVKLMRE